MTAAQIDDLAVELGGAVVNGIIEFERDEDADAFLELLEELGMKSEPLVTLEEWLAGA